MPQALSDLAREMVDTSLEEWRHECEVRHLVDRMTPEQAVAVQGGAAPGARLSLQFGRT